MISIGGKLLQEHSFFYYSKLVVFDGIIEPIWPRPGLKCLLAYFFLCFYQPNLFELG